MIDTAMTPERLQASTCQPVLSWSFLPCVDRHQIKVIFLDQLLCEIGSFIPSRPVKVRPLSDKKSAEATVFIHFYVTDFAILGIQMANFGGTEPWQKRSRGRLFLAWQDRPGMETGGEGKYDKTNFHWWLIWRVGRDTQEMMTGECGEKENTGKAGRVCQT